MTKIGVLIDELISGGFQKVAVMEVKYLREMGYDATLVVLKRSNNLGYQDIIEENNIPTVFLSDRFPNFLKINFKFPFFAFFSFFHLFYPFFIYRFIKDKEFDLFIVHGTYTAFSAISIMKQKNIPYIAYIHDPISYILKQKYTKLIVKLLFKSLISLAVYLDGIIINNAKVVIGYPEMIRILKLIKPNYKNYVQVFNGCECLNELDLKYDKMNYAIAVTKWDQGKNINFLLDIWDDLKIKMPLKIIGSFYPAEFKKTIQETINKKKLDKIIELIGEVTEDKLHEYYQNAKFLVHPCREAFGMTILEASAYGCPSIFTNNSGVAVLYNSHIKGILPVENNLLDYMKLITKFSELKYMDNKNLIKEYYTTAKENSWTKHCKVLIKLF